MSAGAPRGLALACLVAFAAAACQSDPGETACPDAEARLGYRVCVHRVPDDPLWTSITFAAAAIDQERATTYMVPAVKDARLPALFVDANAFPDPEQSLHYKFLTSSFPDLASLTYEQYLRLILDPATREWFAGSVTEYLVAGGDPVLGFTVWDRGTEPGATITCEQFRDVHRTVDKRIGFGRVVVVPANDLQRQTLAACDVPWYDPSAALGYEVYTEGRGCGTLARYTLAELATAEEQGDLGWQSVLVTDEAPFDIETVIAGIVTGTRQGELSHLNVRLAARGTPNCYVKDAYALLAGWDGQLVELVCGPDQATVRAITLQEAQACWDEMQPEPVDVVPADLDWSALVGLLDLPTADAAERLLGVGRYGSKGANLAVLYQRIDADLQLEGFLIPFHFYDAFVTGSTWTVDLGDGVETLTFAEAIDRLLDDPGFTGDAAVRQQRLAALRDAMRATPCDPDLLTEIESWLLATFGADDVMARFRSSSNAEDALAFSGAGLYDSTSVCLADQNDGDADGPSLCDADEPDERDVCRGLTKVWASLWNMGAYEERDWYGIDQRAVAMGILVDTRTKDEQANIVAFSGNPFDVGDDRYVVNAQIGELDVVSSAPGVWPEKDLLALEDGVVTGIERAVGSSELPAGQWVLSEARLSELGAALWTIVEVYPIDAEVPPSAGVLLDTEWKVCADGRLIVKQVRPFLE